MRFQLELLKPELLHERGQHRLDLRVLRIGARARAGEGRGAARRGARPTGTSTVAEKLVAKSHYYDVARELARKASRFPVDEDGKRHFVVMLGRRAVVHGSRQPRRDATRAQESIGLNIVLPHEQLPNTFVTPDLSFQFHYFALRKMHFLLRARAVAVFPGGFGTFDEMFELLTLIQTGKVRPLPILLFGREFWERVVDFQGLAEEGVISPADLDLITWCETADEAWDAVCEHYESPNRRRPRRLHETGGASRCRP